MSVVPPTAKPANTDETGDAPQQDQTAPEGSSQLIRNVLFNWAGHFVLVVSGFVLPRLIDNRLGQASLGVWDFGWSVVSYCAFATSGIRSAVTTYVSRYASANDWDHFNEIVNSCLLIFTALAAVSFIVMTGIVIYLPQLFGDSLAGQVETAQWTLAILALSAVLQLPMGVFTGVLTGNQRYDLVNVIEGSTHILIVGGIIVMLLVGGPLHSLAIAVLIGQLIADVWKYVAAHRVAPQLRITPRYVRWSTIKFAAAFGGKDMLEYGSRVLMHQTNNILVGAFLGAPALALFARPAALVQHAARFLTKFGAVFEPTASAIYARGDLDQLRDLLVKGVRYSLYVALPVVIGLSLLGGALLELWMGPNYRASTLLAVLAVGNLGFLSQRVTYHVLLGIGQHGRAARAMFFGALVAVAASTCALAIFDAGLVGVAVATVVPFTIVNAIYLPFRACRVTQMNLSEFARRVLPGPLLSVTPFAIGLLITRWVSGDQLGWPILWGVLASGAVLAIIYWHVALPMSMKSKIRKTLRIPPATAT